MPATETAWLRFGRWPSRHDIDLVLYADEPTYAEAERLADGLDPHDGSSRLVTVAELPTPDLTPWVTLAAGPPLDLFLSPAPGCFSVAAWVPALYDIAEVGWRPTLDPWFFPPRGES